LVEKLGAEGALERATQNAIEALNYKDTVLAVDWLHVMRILMEDRAETRKVPPASAEPIA
jgi:hypothetical protein